MTDQANKAVMESVIEWCDSVLSDIENVEYRNAGVCKHVWQITEGLDDLPSYSAIQRIIRAWPERGTSSVFPVEGEEVYMPNKDKWVGEIGAKRLRLVKHIRDALLGEVV
jgi:hypothetical protein